MDPTTRTITENTLVNIRGYFNAFVSYEAYGSGNFITCFVTDDNIGIELFKDGLRTSWISYARNNDGWTVLTNATVRRRVNHLIDPYSLEYFKFTYNYEMIDD